MKKPILTLALLSCLVSSHVIAKDEETFQNLASSEIRLGTWNIKRLGHGTKRLDLVAKVVEKNMDVLVIQEVMTSTGVADLLKNLPGWSGAVTKPVGKNGYMEQYAIIARNSVAKVVNLDIVPDVKDVWTRDPSLGCVKAKQVDFCVVGTHVVFGDSTAERDSEIDALSKLLADLRDKSATEKDYILVGDFNRPGNSPKFKSFSPLGFVLADDGVTKTSISYSGWASPYDHVLYDPKNTKEIREAAKRIDIVSEVCEGSFKMCNDLVSDHAPLVVKILDADDD